MNSLGLGIEYSVFIEDGPTQYFEILAEDGSYMTAENGDYLIVQ